MAAFHKDQHYTILTGCQSGKRGYHSRSDAKEAARKSIAAGNGRMRPYVCDCGFWHLGHLQARKKQGYFA